MSEKRMTPVGEELAIGQILIMVSEQFDEEGREKLRERYRAPEGTEKITGNRHCMITGMAINALWHCVSNGATGEEVNRLITYITVCIDARKYILDYAKCYRDLELDRMLKKYGAKRPKQEQTV